ncbi:MAG: helix-turn-helix domain-containing protein [Burkholderiaceae bacterium]
MRPSIVLAISIPECFRKTGAPEVRCDGVFEAREDRDVVVWSPLGTASLEMRVQGPPSVRAVWHGAQSYVIGRRTLCVDEDNYLVLNGSREYSALAHRGYAAESLTIFFSRDTRLAHDTKVPERDFFAEHLLPHDDVVTPCLRRLRDARRCGVADLDWYAVQIRQLYSSLLAADNEWQHRAMAFSPASLATRTELLRRVMSATDYVNSNYMSAVTLDDIASAAHLSKYHLARLFRALHGVSPAAYLRLKRIRAAERLIERSDADLAEIAERSGFGSRWSMFRELRRRRGMGGRRIRESWIRSTTSAISSV